MSTQQVVCEHSLRGVLSSLSSPHHRTPWCGRACSQATQQALVRYSQKNANQWKRWGAFKLAVCIMPIVLFRISLPHSLSLTMFFFIVFLTTSHRYFPSDISVYHFSSFRWRDFPRFLLSHFVRGLREVLRDVLREVCSSCKKCLRRHDANHCRWQQRAGNRITGCS